MVTARESSVLTVAAICTGRNKAVEYLFNERQCIFTPAPSIAADERSLILLREALSRKRPVKVALDTRRGLIQRVSEPTRRELDEFARTRVPLEKPDKVVKIEVDKIDPTTFNIADLYLKWPSFRVCTKIVPSYAKAKAIFDFARSSRATCRARTLSRHASRSNTSATGATRGRTRCVGSSRHATVTAAKKSSASPTRAATHLP